jgi:predicted lipoprotein with Yx(FWY)xxD motif
MSRVEVAVVRGAKWIAPIGAAVIVCALAVTVALANPGARTASVGATGATGTTGTSGPATTVATHRTKRGKVLSTAKGRSLYLFTADRSSRSRCSGRCAKTWKPLLTRAQPVAARNSGVNAKLLGTTRRDAHTLQVTYKGHPLYTYVKDTRAGQINGENRTQFGGHWYLVYPSGNAVKPPRHCDPSTEYCPLGS